MWAFEAGVDHGNGYSEVSDVFVEIYQGRYIETISFSYDYDGYWEAVVDERFTSAEQKRIIYQKLGDIDPSVRRGVEEEFLDPYPHALVRLRAVGRTDVVGDKVARVEESLLKKRPPL